MNLSITLQANPVDRQTAYNDAILNGLELFKISSVDRNLYGPNPDPTPSTTVSPPIQKSTGQKNNEATIIGIVSGLVAGIIVISIGVHRDYDSGRSIKEAEILVCFI